MSNPGVEGDYPEQYVELLTGAKLDPSDPTIIETIRRTEANRLQLLGQLRNTIRKKLSAPSKQVGALTARDLLGDFETYAVGLFTDAGVKWSSHLPRKEEFQEFISVLKSWIITQIFPPRLSALEVITQEHDFQVGIVKLARKMGLLDELEPGLVEHGGVPLDLSLFHGQELDKKDSSCLDHQVVPLDETVASFCDGMEIPKELQIFRIDARTGLWEETIDLVRTDLSKTDRDQSPPDYVSELRLALRWPSNRDLTIQILEVGMSQQETNLWAAWYTNAANSKVSSLSRPVAVRKRKKSAVAGDEDANIFPNRALWFKNELKKRGWSVHDVERQRGPDHKTGLKILNGMRVTEGVLEKLATALSQKGAKVDPFDIPPD